MEKKSLIHEIKIINSDIFKAISNRYKRMNIDITPMHARIIMTIYKSNDSLCQKDLESSMSCNKSTMSSIISTMEKNGLLVRQTCKQDSRINYLVLTDKGLEIVDFLKKDRKHNEKILMDGISDDEYLVFTQVVDKIRNNLERI
jgi:DNA-binding MarR family transcriptional regulator